MSRPTIRWRVAIARSNGATCSKRRSARRRGHYRGHLGGVHAIGIDRDVYGNPGGNGLEHRSHSPRMYPVAVNTREP